MIIFVPCVHRLENYNVEVCNLENSEKYQVRYHDSCVLSLKYAHKNDWFISTGKDQVINGWKSPYAANIFKVSFKIRQYNILVLNKKLLF